MVSAAPAWWSSIVLLLHHHAIALFISGGEWRESLSLAMLIALQGCQNACALLFLWTKWKSPLTPCGRELVRISAQLFEDSSRVFGRVVLSCFFYFRKVDVHSLHLWGGVPPWVTQTFNFLDADGLVSSAPFIHSQPKNGSLYSYLIFILSQQNSKSSKLHGKEILRLSGTYQDSHHFIKKIVWWMSVCTCISTELCTKIECRTAILPFSVRLQVRLRRIPFPYSIPNATNLVANGMILTGRC